MVVHFNGNVVFDRNECNSVIHFHSCSVYFHANLSFINNNCNEMIFSKSNYRFMGINIMKHAIVKFIENM